jgi:hypothetical protein
MQIPGRAGVIMKKEQPRYMFACRCGNLIREDGFLYNTEKAWSHARCNNCGAEVTIRYRRP